MRRNFIFIFCFCFCSLMMSCQRKTSDDELAERMAKSENFKAIMSFGKNTAGFVKPLPDSIKAKLRKTKELLESVQKDIGLNVKQKRDSIFKIVRSTSLYDSIIKDTTSINKSKEMSSVYRNFYAEFPEYKKLPKEEQSIVFKKAAAILRNPKQRS